MYLHEIEAHVPVDAMGGSILQQVARGIARHTSDDQIPVRVVVTESGNGMYKCEVGLFQSPGTWASLHQTSTLNFSKRLTENSQSFNAVLLVPTGIGAEIGGHAGDATPVATLMASICDTLITHPNVLNGSDLIDLSSNTLYLEGSAISRLLMGSVGLQPVRSNRVLVVIDSHPDEFFVDAPSTR